MGCSSKLYVSVESLNAESYSYATDASFCFLKGHPDDVNIYIKPFMYITVCSEFIVPCQSSCSSSPSESA